jgi:molybdopterin-binding protein
MRYDSPVQNCTIYCAWPWAGGLYTYADATELTATSYCDCVPMQNNGKSEGNTEGLLKLRDAALQLGISFPTIKQWIYKKKIRSNRTAGGHHRIPQSEVDRLLFRTRGKTEQQRKQEFRRVSGRNQLVGRIESVQISGLLAEVKLSIGGQQVTSIITAHSAREMQLKRGQTAAALIKATEVMILRV